MNTPVKKQRGREEIFKKRDQLVAALRAVRDGNPEDPRMASRFLLKRMEERELVAFETIHKGGRGRPAQRPVLTNTGIAFLATA
jgi:hypothetical protein